MMSDRRFHHALLLSAILCASLSLSACVAVPERAGPPPAATVVVARPPPVELVETPPPPPGPREVWVWQRGHWHWDGFNYRWEPGHWKERPAYATAWIPAHWETNVPMATSLLKVAGNNPREFAWVKEDGGWSDPIPSFYASLVARLLAV